MGRLQDIDLVDQRRIGLGDSKSDIAAAGDEGEKDFALRFGELLGIVEAGEFRGQTRFRPAGGEDDSGGHHRPGERPAPGLVHACDAHPILPPQGALELEPVNGFSGHLNGFHDDAASPARQ